MRSFFLTCAVFVSLTLGQTFEVTGRVISSDSQPVAEAFVRLLKNRIADTTDQDGRFQLTGLSTSIRNPIRNSKVLFYLQKGFFIVTHTSNIKRAALAVFSLQGKRLFSIPYCSISGSSCVFNLNNMTNGLSQKSSVVILQLTVNEAAYRFKAAVTDRLYSIPSAQSFDRSRKENEKVVALSSTPLDTMAVFKTGHITRRFPVETVKCDYGEIISGNQFIIIDSNLVDAEYSAQMGLIVFVCKSPDRAILYNPVTEEKSVLSLNKIPTCVSVSPDGEHAAIGHDAMISYVDLGSKTFTAEYFVSCPVFDIVLGDNGYAYSFPGFDQWVKICCMNLSTKKETACGRVYAGTKAKLHPSGNYIYGASNGLDPSYFERYDISADTISNTYRDSYNGTYYFSGDVWISEDGERLYAKSGNTFSSNPLPGSDMLYAGRLNYSILWVSNSREKALLAVLPTDSEIDFYNPRYLNSIGTFMLASLVEPSVWATPKGKFVFFSQNGEACTIVLTGKEHLFAAYTMNDDHYPTQ